MKIAELFVNLGIKGKETTGKALGDVKTGLGEVKSMSLEAKAAIAGAIYALERMMSSSAATGTSLSNFAAATGMSAQKLQEFQYAARQVGVEGESVTASLKNVQSTMMTMLQTGQAPQGMSMFADFLAKQGETLSEAKIRDTGWMITKLQEMSRAFPPDIIRGMVQSFGISEDVFAAMRKNAFRPDVMAKAPKYSDGEIGQLNRVDVAWKNLGQKIQMAMGHFTSKHGVQLVSDLSKITTEVIKLADALANFADKFKIFQLASDVFDGITKSLRLINGEGIDSIMKDDKKNHHFGDGTWWMNLINSGENKFLDMKSQLQSGLSVQKPQQQPVNQTVNVHTNVHGVKDAKDVGKHIETHVNRAVRQLKTTRQGA
jgi:hypothetical protein